MSLKYILCFFLLAFPYGSAAFELPKETYVFDVTAQEEKYMTKSYKQVLLLCGISGSGKTTFARSA